MRVSGVSVGEAPTVGVNSGDVCVDAIVVPTRMLPPPKPLPTAANSGVVSVATGSSAFA